jgi:hypothetical protein
MWVHDASRRIIFMAGAWKNISGYRYGNNFSRCRLRQACNFEPVETLSMHTEHVYKHEWGICISGISRAAFFVLVGMGMELWNNFTNRGHSPGITTHTHAASMRMNPWAAWERPECAGQLPRSIYAKNRCIPLVGLGDCPQKADLWARAAPQVLKARGAISTCLGSVQTVSCEQGPLKAGQLRQLVGLRNPNFLLVKAHSHSSMHESQESCSTMRVWQGKAPEKPEVWLCFSQARPSFFE